MSTVSERHPPLSNPAEPPERPDFGDPDADIILRSCDHHEFRVLKLYIIKVSTVLRELIESASSSHAANATSSLPSIQLSDSGATLSSLLTFVLPVPPVLPSTIEQTMLLLSAAQKYQMDPTLSHIRGNVALQDPPFIRPETAFRVYSLAQTYGLRREALHAARITLTFRFTLENLEDELVTVPGVHLHELWSYHNRVRTYLADDLTAFKTTISTTSLYCSGDEQAWLVDYIGSIAKSPDLFDLTEFHMCLSRHVRDLRTFCQCAALPNKTIHTFWVALTNVVHNCMTKGELDILITGGPLTGPSPTCSKNTLSMPDRLDMSDADIIIQSRDLINFRVHKSTLAMSSPFFEDMLSLPQPSDDERVDGLPVVRLPEEAEVLNSLLTMLYPIPSVMPNTYDKSLTLLAVSQKYDMVGVQSHIRGEIHCRNFATPTGAATFRAYAISSRGGLQSEMESSARLTLGFPMTFEFCCDELPFFDGWALRDLISFRKRTRDNLVSCFQSFNNLSQAPFNIWMSCTPSCSSYYGNNPTGYSPPWLTDFFMQRVTELLQAFTKPLLHPSSVREGYLSALRAHIDSINCISCMRVHARNGETFCKELESRLVLALSTVQLSRNALPQDEVQDQNASAFDFDFANFE